LINPILTHLELCRRFSQKLKNVIEKNCSMYSPNSVREHLKK
jgi:hypothetical protein